MAGIDMEGSYYMTKGASRGDVPLDEGAEWEWLPAQLCADLTLLILEGRQPEWSVKGRTEGDHCPPAQGTSMHHCQRDKETCGQIASVAAYISFLCRNDIPVSVEVLLYPDCCYGTQNRIEVGASAEGGKEQVPGLQEYVVLEQWIIQVLPKRFPDGYSHFHVLMQAVRSFLHFSQLGAWLSSTQGRAPANIVYRVCAHGESFAENTKVQPELHTFPFLNISKTSSLQVSVASLPRQQSIPQPACFLPIHNKRNFRKTKTFNECETSHKHRSSEEHGSPNYFCGTQPSGPPQDRHDKVYGLQERSESYDRQRRQSRELHGESEKPNVHRQFPGVGESDSRRGSLEQEWGFEAIQQKKAQMRNSNKLRDSPKLIRTFPSAYRTEYSQLPGEAEKVPELSQSTRSESIEDIFTPLTSLLDVKTLNTADRIHDIVCENVKEAEDMKYHEKLVELEEGLSSLKLHHIPATPCNVYCTPEIDSTESRSTSICSTDSDQGIVFTAGPLSDVFTSEWEENEILQSEKKEKQYLEDLSIYKEEGLKCETEEGSNDLYDEHADSQDQGLSDFDSKFQYRSHLERSIHMTSSNTSLDSCTYSHLHGSSNSLVSLCNEICHQPNADLCYIPSDGARVSVEECAARRRHVSGNSQDGFESGRSASCETLTNQSAIQSDGSESQRFNAAIFKNKALQDSNSVKSSPSSSPMASPRRAMRSRACGTGWADDFKPNISAPFSSNGVVPPVKEEKENSESAFQFPPPDKGKSLLRNVLSKTHQVEEAKTEIGCVVPKESGAKACMRRSLDGSRPYVFHPRTGLPINSSPAPLRKAKTTSDCPSLLKPIGLTSSPSCNNLEKPSSLLLGHPMRMLSTSAPASSCLLGNFEESVLNGRLEPLGTIDGFTAEIGASGAFCPKHICLPVTTFFYSVCDDDAPSSYFGHINLESLGKRGYHVPSSGTIQVTLFNPNKTVVKMFVVRYDLSDMPPNCQTFARQRIFYMPSDVDINDECDKELRYLMHLRFLTSKSGKVYLHTDIRMIFARHTPDLESSFGTFELRSFTEVPTNPRFSPKK
ncbi:protein FAM214A-like isoform X1 [Lytechinus variegatus]|uniref:protein FAM214A-like isoform X1 n=1 Tax=Lytechinus variegatus TaxID=7654 RepID=UPI001BB148EE|nr:protein FAM214A-like isoform X1 [Lytechinus variegatus]